MSNDSSTIDRFSLQMHRLRVEFNFIWGGIGIFYAIYILFFVLIRFWIPYTTKFIAFLCIGVLFTSLALYFYKKKAKPLVKRRLFYYLEIALSFIVAVMLMVSVTIDLIEDLTPSESFDLTWVEIKDELPRIINGTVLFELHPQSNDARRYYQSDLTFIADKFFEIYGVNATFEWFETVPELTKKSFSESKRYGYSVYIWIVNGKNFKVALHDKFNPIFIRYESAYGVTPSNDLIVVPSVYKIFERSAIIFCHEFGHTLNIQHHFFFQSGYLMSSNPPMKGEVKIHDDTKERIVEWHSKNEYSDDEWRVPSKVRF